MARSQQQILEQMLGAQQLQLAALVARIEDLEEQLKAKDKRPAKPTAVDKSA
jgi:BMFP domain-containing protein YqiC